jgi:hypothetical protein
MPHMNGIALQRNAPLHRLACGEPYRNEGLENRPA